MTHPDWPHAHDGAELDGPDAPLDAALLDAARDYHRPPPTPADAIWAGIQARRAGRAAPAAGAPLDAPTHVAPQIAPPHDGPPFARDDLAVRRLARGGRAVPRWATLAAAAVLLVAAGVGIGRQTAPGGPLPVAATAAAPAAEAPRATPRATPEPTSVALAPEPTPEAPAASRRAPRDAAPDARRPGARAPSRRRRRRGGARAGRGPAPRRHRAAPRAAEALLTGFAGGGGRGRARAPADSVWARDLLTTTRLLLDSPAGADPARRELLETLELVLVQIARLPRADSPGERALIDRAIRQGDLMTRLRGAVPAGSPAPRAALGT
jgi:hypothetical protein